MAVRIRSLLTSGPIMVPLSTGQHVRLSPGERSDELHDVEVAGNAKVDKLRRHGLVEVETVDTGSEAPAAAVAVPQARGHARPGQDTAE